MSQINVLHIALKSIKAIVSIKDGFDVLQAIQAVFF
jgi:hypothetical protein